MSIENKTNLTTALSYYEAMLRKDFETMARFLDEDICLVSPLAEIHGKAHVVGAAQNFGGMLQDIQIGSRFENGNQVMLAYVMVVPQPIGAFRAAALMTFNDDKIMRIELFYDARPFEIKKSDIFEKAA